MSVYFCFMNLEKLLSLILVLHIAGGTIALISGLISMLSAKGGHLHKLAGKIYFWGMTAVFMGALIIATSRKLDFLLMVAFFSYYMTVRGYRILSLKKLHQGQQAATLDWMILLISGIFVITLFGWGIWALISGASIGIVGGMLIGRTVRKYKMKFNAAL